jgi:NADH-quinone oxidoreductase subunit L
MARAVYLTFFGEYKGSAHPHESPKVMTYPLIGLAALSAVAGFANMPGIYTGFTSWVGARLHAMGDHHAESVNFLLAGIGLAVALAGIAAGTRLWRADRATQLERDRFRIPVLYPLLARKYYIDDLYLKGVVGPIKGPIARATNWSNTYIIDGIVNGVGAVARVLSGFVYRGIDQRGIDLAFNAAASATGGAGEQLRYTTTGRVQQYAWALFSGAILLVIGFLIFT